MAATAPWRAQMRGQVVARSPGRWTAGQRSGGPRTSPKDHRAQPEEHRVRQSDARPVTQHFGHPPKACSPHHAGQRDGHVEDGQGSGLPTIGRGPAASPGEDLIADPVSPRMNTRPMRRPRASSHCRSFPRGHVRPLAVARDPAVAASQGGKVLEVLDGAARVLTADRSWGTLAPVVDPWPRRGGIAHVPQSHRPVVSRPRNQ